MSAQKVQRTYRKLHASLTVEKGLFVAQVYETLCDNPAFEVDLYRDLTRSGRRAVRLLQQRGLVQITSRAGLHLVELVSR